MSQFDILISIINNKNNNNTFNLYIKNVIKQLFNNLNNYDLNNLQILTIYLINRIKLLLFDNEQNNEINNDKLNNNEQFMQNNDRDIKAILLLLLPFIDDENINIYSKITDLNEILYSVKNSNYISKDILELDRNEILQTYFKFSNMSLGLINPNRNIILNLNTNTKLINDIIHHNFIALLETLSIINGKLYINWVNVVPLNFDNYKNSQIYKNTINKEQETKLNTKLEGIINKIINDDYSFSHDLLDYNGLYIGEFYNIYRNIYYENMKKIKWLLFIYDNKYLIQYLDIYLDLSQILINNSYNDLSDVDKNIFTNKIRSVKLSNNIDMWKNIIIFMVNNYSSKLIIQTDISKSFLINNIDNDSYASDYIKGSIYDKITNDDIYNYLQNIEPEFVWEYLKESLINFESTIYSKYLIKNNSIDNNYFYYDDNITLKNIYNIAKSLSHTTDWVLLPTKFTSLNFNLQKQFFEKYHNTNIKSWFNIRKNLNREKLSKISNKEYFVIINNIETSWNKIKYKLIWDYLIYNGILSKFQSNINLTDKKLGKKTLSKNIKANYNKNKTVWLNSYYYLTNKKYSELNKIRLRDKIYNKVYEENYLDTLFNDQAWFSFYAMDWIAQIGFFHHYLNHRIMYITGATGQGKSTQVPKLFMYALKALDYKINGKVICSQPRIAPTTNNASQIADQLGLPIEQYSYTTNIKIKTNNFYVQYKHQKDNHQKSYCNYLTLKLVTDGTLYELMKSNPSMKVKSYTKNKDLHLLTDKNEYDIIIIDEAHEHNTNMDLILTLGRQSCYYNNSIKLIIVSATMNDDEPIYRSYYKYINDNLVYPIKNKIYHPFLLKINGYETNLLFRYDNIYLDRRYHISPPGETTQYEINEIYLSNSIININNSEKQNSDLTQEKSYEIIKKICSETITGDILLFVNGINEIMKAIKYLNSVLPSNTIALPYHANLHPLYKNIIENIDKKINNIKTEKNQVADTWSTIFIENNSVPDGIYKRVVIVATNVAEASITISSLKFVVDNGYSKVNNFDDYNQISELNVEMIPESSRKQRKGRVGRVGDGSVYYIYEKGTRQYIKPKYKITQEDLTNIFTDLLVDTKESITEDLDVLLEFNPELNEALLFNKNADPNIYNVFLKNNDINTGTKLYNTIINQFVLLFEDDIEIFLKELWNNDYYDYMGNNPLDFLYRYESGYLLPTLIDTFGNFYLIHPFETKIKRNVANQIISNEILIKTNTINKNNYFNTFHNLRNKLLIINTSGNKFNEDIFTEIHDWNLTEFVSYINKFVNEINDVSLISNTSEALLLLTAYAYDSFIQVLEIFIMLKANDNKISKLLIKVNKSYNNQDNEIIFIHNIITKFKNTFDFNIFKIKKLSDFNNQNYEYELLIETYLHNRKKSLLDPPKNFNPDLWNKLNSIYENGEIYKNNINILNDKQFLNEIYNNKKEITNWCIKNNINSETFLNFLVLYSNALIAIFSNKKDTKYNEESIFDFIDNFKSTFQKSLTSSNIEEKILRPFIHAYPENICFYDSTRNSQYYEGFDAIKYLNDDTKKNTTSLIFYYSKKINTLEYISMSITNSIEIKWLISALPVFYRPSNFTNIYVKKNNNNKNGQITIVSSDSYYWNYLCNKIHNEWTYYNIPFDTELLPKLYQYFKNLKKNMLLYN